MTEAMPFLQKAILLSYDPRPFLVGVIVAFVYGYGGMFAAGNMSLANIYPITASLGLIGYRSYDASVHWNMALCVFSIAIVIGISAILIALGKDQEPQPISKKRTKRAASKKGW